MEYEVQISPEALKQAEEAYLWILEESGSRQVADRWFNELIAAIDTLALQPKRCSYAPENDYFKEEIRQYLHGKSRNRYRILFTIDDNTVHILHIRHSAKRPLDQE